MKHRELDLLLDRYINGDCSPSEEAALRHELAKDEESLALADALRAAQGRAARAELDAHEAVSAGPADVTAALARLDRRLVDANLRPAVTPRFQLRLENERAGNDCLEKARSARPAATVFQRSHGLRAAAAAFVLLAGAGAMVWMKTRDASNATFANTTPMRELATARGQRAIFQLLDGTEVVLGVDSRLRIPTNYGTSRRDVQLEGEAYFTVVHDDGRPFVVHTAHGSTRDIGTKFVVRAYRDDGAESVVVTEGAVAVAAKAPRRGGEQLLKAGQGATVSPLGAVAVIEHPDIEGELAWTRGELRFSNTPFRAVIRRLSQWYDIDVQLIDSALANRPVSGAYVGESVDQVLTLVTAAVGADFERHGKHVVVSAALGGKP